MKPPNDIDAIINSWLNIKPKKEDLPLNKDFDENLANVAGSYNMTARQVKSVLFNLCSDKNMLNLALQNAGDLPKRNIPQDYNTVITRKRYHSMRISEPVITPISALDRYFNETYNEETDPDYKPLTVVNITSDDDNVNHEMLKISNRTRSRKPQEVQFLNEINQEKDESDVEESIIINDIDVDWVKFLTESIEKDSIQVDDTDDDFQFKYEDMEEDDEEFRDDKAVTVSHREIQIMFNGLEEEEVNFFMRKNRPHFLKSTSFDLPTIPKQLRHLVIAQLQQYIQCLVQLYMFGTFYRECHSVADQCRMLLEEILFFTPKENSSNSILSSIDGVELKTLKMFSSSNIIEAMAAINKWDKLKLGEHTPMLFGPTPATTSEYTHDINYASILRIKTWGRDNDPKLPIRLSTFFVMEPFFTGYPALLPTNGILLLDNSFAEPKKIDSQIFDYCFGSRNLTTTHKCKFSETEMYLLLIGHYQFGDDFNKIHNNVVPTRGCRQLESKYKLMIHRMKHLSLDIKLILTRGNTSLDEFKCPDVSDIPNSLNEGPLLRLKYHPTFPAWFRLISIPSNWSLMFINYDILGDGVKKELVLDEARAAMTTKTYAIIPNEAVIHRDTKYDQGLNTPTDDNSSNQHDFEYDIELHTKMNLSYPDLANHAVVIMESNGESISILLSYFIIALCRDFTEDTDEFKQILQQLHCMENETPSTVFNKLITLFKGKTHLIQLLSFIFGIKSPETRVRFLQELLRYCRNLQQLQHHLGINTFHHQRLIFFLSRLGDIDYANLNIRQVISLLPVNLEQFKKIPITSDLNIPTFLGILQSYIDEPFEDIVYENMQIHHEFDLNTVTHAYYDERSAYIYPVIQPIVNIITDDMNIKPLKQNNL